MMAEQLTSRCRAHLVSNSSTFDDSFHVEYTTDFDNVEKQNLTHAKSIDTEAIEERDEC
jgi:hypothetical protein